MIKQLLIGISSLMLSCVLEAAPNNGNVPAQQQGAKTNNLNETREKYDIMLRDQKDSTDTYAIPLDDSEIEDEEEINAAEKRQVFPLPQAR